MGAGRSPHDKLLGPLANVTGGITEQYLYSGTNKTRLVQYFDKGRRELYGGGTNTPDVRVLTILFAVAFHGGKACAFFARSGGAQLTHVLEVVRLEWRRLSPLPRGEGVGG